MHTRKDQTRIQHQDRTIPRPTTHTTQTTLPNPQILRQLLPQRTPPLTPQRQRTPQRYPRDHKNRQWWEAMLSWTHYKRAKEGATQRRQGIFQEHEDMIARILGDTWQTTALLLSKKARARTCRTKAQAYLIMHSLPPHP